MDGFKFFPPDFSGGESAAAGTGFSFVSPSFSSASSLDNNNAVSSPSRDQETPSPNALFSFSGESTSPFFVPSPNKISTEKKASSASSSPSASASSASSFGFVSGAAPLPFSSASSSFGFAPAAAASVSPSSPSPSSAAANKDSSFSPWTSSSPQELLSSLERSVRGMEARLFMMERKMDRIEAVERMADRALKSLFVVENMLRSVSDSVNRSSNVRNTALLSGQVNSVSSALHVLKELEEHPDISSVNQMLNESRTAVGEEAHDDIGDLLFSETVSLFLHESSESTLKAALPLVATAISANATLEDFSFESSFCPAEFFGCLAKKSLLSKITLELNSTGDYMSFSAIVEQLPSLRKLSISSYQMFDKGLSSVVDRLADSICPLQRLHVQVHDGDAYGRGSATVAALARMVKARRGTFKKIDFCDCAVLPATPNLSLFFANLAECTELVKFNMSFCHQAFDLKGKIGIEQFLRSSTSLRSFELDISSLLNHFSDELTAGIGNAPSLETVSLDVSDKSNLFNIFLEKLAARFKSNTIKKLSLRFEGKSTKFDALKEILQLPVEKFQLYARSQDRNVGHVRTILMDNFCKSNFIVAPRVICLDAGLANQQFEFMNLEKVRELELRSREAFNMKGLSMALSRARYLRVLKYEGAAIAFEDFSVLLTTLQKSTSFLSCLRLDFTMDEQSWRMLMNAIKDGFRVKQVIFNAVPAQRPELAEICKTLKSKSLTELSYSGGYNPDKESYPEIARSIAEADKATRYFLMMVSKLDTEPNCPLNMLHFGILQELSLRITKRGLRSEGQTSE